MTLPQITEHQAARQWRESAGLSRAQLAKLTGYSISAIQDYERGTLSTGRPVDPAMMQRFRLACAAIAFRKAAFAWDKLPSPKP